MDEKILGNNYEKWNKRYFLADWETWLARLYPCVYGVATTDKIVTTTQIYSWGFDLGGVGLKDQLKTLNFLLTAIFGSWFGINRRNHKLLTLKYLSSEKCFLKINGRELQYLAAHNPDFNWYPTKVIQFYCKILDSLLKFWEIPTNFMRLTRNASDWVIEDSRLLFRTLIYGHPDVS